MSQQTSSHPPAAASSRFDAFGWALAFIWIGAAMLANLGWAWLLIGLGAIVLAEQVLARLAHGTISGFWIACGVVLVGGGVWQLFGLTLPLGPLLLILLGVAIFIGALRRRPEGGAPPN